MGFADLLGTVRGQIWDGEQRGKGSTPLAVKDTESRAHGRSTHPLEPRAGEPQRHKNGMGIPKMGTRESRAEPGELWGLGETRGTGITAHQGSSLKLRLH